jgi:antitoxin component YwqK of YwqJK toxin-antitoxin module
MGTVIGIVVIIAYLFGLVAHIKRHFPELLIRYEYYPDGTILSVHMRALFKATWKWFYTEEGVLFRRVKCKRNREIEGTQQMYYPSGKLKVTI